MQEAAQLELDPPSDQQPVQLKEAGSLTSHFSYCGFIFFATIVVFLLFKVDIFDVDLGPQELCAMFVLPLNMIRCL